MNYNEEKFQKTKLKTVTIYSSYSSKDRQDIK
jgi:hypothetical protein